MTGADVIKIVGIVVTVIPGTVKAIKKMRAKTKNFGPALDKLQDTMTLIEPKIKELDRMNQQNYHDKFSEEVIPVFKKLLEEGETLVSKCKKLPKWNKIKKYKYAKRLVELESTIWRLLNIEFLSTQLVRNCEEKINKNCNCNCMKLHTS